MKEHTDSNDSIRRIELQMEILKERGLNTYLNDNLNYFGDKFDRLKELLTEEANNQNFNEAYDIFYEIFDYVPLMYNELQVPYIYRAQSNNNNELFTSSNRISYNKTNPHIITPGKFNIWYDAMFYGSLPYKSIDKHENLPPSLTACLECCKELNNESKKLFYKDITVGKWQIKAKITAVNLCYDDTHLSHNFEMKEEWDIFFHSLKQYYSQEAGFFIDEIFKYYSGLCRIGSDKGAYYILSAFFYAIREYYKLNTKDIRINGIISPSAATDGRGLNIVLTPGIVNDNLLLESVRMYRFFLVLPEADTYSIYPCSEMIVNSLKNTIFNFSFKKYINPAPRFLKRLSL